MAILFKFCKITNPIRFLGRNEELKVAEYPLTPTGNHLDSSKQTIKEFMAAEEQQEQKESIQPQITKQTYWFTIFNENTKNSSTFFSLSKRLSENLSLTLTDIAAGKLPGVSINRISC